MLKIKKEAPVTLALIVLNIVIYVADHAYSGNSLFSGEVSLFARDFLLSPPDVLNGEYWVFFTYMFLHANALHLGMNMLSLWQMGPIAEEILGKTRFLLLYLIAGVLGAGVSLFQKAFSETLSVSLGASGAVFGVAGIFFAIVWVRSRDSQEFLSHPYVRQAGTNILLFTFATAFAGILIDHYAHAGGFFAGGALTVFWCRFRVPSNKKQMAALVLVILCMMTAYGIYPKGSEGIKLSRAKLAFDRGLVAYDQHNYADAETQFTEAIKHEPNNPRALYNLHLAQLLQQDLAGAIVSLETLEQILIADPNLDRENTEGFVSLKKVREQLKGLREFINSRPQ